MVEARRRIPVILDTDIGGDIDDTWALAMMLRTPELDVKLVTSATNDTVYRAKIVARMLEIAGRTDIPVGIGVRQKDDGPRQRQMPWVRDYDLSRYPGTVHQDGVDAMIRTIRASPEPVTVVAIGPLPNVAEALGRAPEIAGRARFVGMLGSIAKQHENRPGAIAEFNVKLDIAACQRVFAAPWEITITPLDTCGYVRLDAERYRAVCDCADPLTRAVIENYRIWLSPNDPAKRTGAETASTILFDTVAVHLAFSTGFLAMKRMGLRVTDDGFTLPDARARPVDVALDWTDHAGYLDSLVRRLTGAERP